MPLKWNTPLPSGYEWYLEPYFDRFGQMLPAPMLANEWLMGTECVLRDTLEREQLSLQLLVRSQSQRESASNTTNESSATGGGYSNNSVNSAGTTITARKAINYVNSDDSTDYPRYG
jgi:hypothetical protein